MMVASYEVCLLTSPVRNDMPRLRQMVSPLYRLHRSTLDCVELHFSDERDALLLRLCFSELYLDQRRQRELVQCLAESGFEVLESSEIADSEKPRFEQLLQEQYEVHLLQFPSPESPSLVSTVLDFLETHLAPKVAEKLSIAPAPLAMPAQVAVQKGAPRLATVDAFDHIISEIPILERTVADSNEAIEIDSESDRADTMAVEEGEECEGGAYSEYSEEVEESEGGAYSEYSEEVEESEDSGTQPVRMETVGPLDGLITKLPRAQTQESLDSILDKLWP